MEAITQRDVKESLLPLMSKGEQITADEMKSSVVPLLEKFLSFEGSDMEFIEAMYDRKNYRPDMLLPGSDYSPEVVDHPGIKWKIKHL
ncbi:MAG: hypothetical protein ACP5EK_06590 [Thermoplasmatota archaeon]